VRCAEARQFMSTRSLLTATEVERRRLNRHMDQCQACERWLDENGAPMDESDPRVKMVRIIARRDRAKGI
jgi:predicted anti-sigma-YlaC factor YlaD